MLSFFGEQMLKNAVVERVKAHQRLLIEYGGDDSSAVIQEKS